MRTAKAQALSLPTAIVDAGSACFGTGMIDVALSRVTGNQYDVIVRLLVHIFRSLLGMIVL